MRANITQILITTLEKTRAHQRMLFIQKGKKKKKKGPSKQINP